MARICHPKVWEAEIGKVEVPSQPRQKKKVWRPHIHGKKLGVVTCACYPSHRRMLKIGGYRPLAWAKRETLSNN
jgi:hypothetical protein